MTDAERILRTLAAVLKRVDRSRDVDRPQAPPKPPAAPGRASTERPA